MAKVKIPVLAEGETYAGPIGNPAGEDYHLILMPGETNGNFKAAEDWAKKSGGSLPTRREQFLLFANCKEEFSSNWYWSGETYSVDPAYAWCQCCINGRQYYSHKFNKLRARAVRRVPLEIEP